MNEMEKQIARDKEQGITNRAIALKGARDVVSGIEAEMSEATGRADQYRGVIVKAKTELEMLGSIENLTAELRRRQIDLEETISTHEAFVGGIEKDTPNFNHRLRVAKLGVDDAEDAIAMARATDKSDGPPPHERQKLMSTPRAKLDFATKEAIISKWGQEFYKSIPLA